MKEITRINLASLPYNVEIEAKKELEKYCAGIERNLGADADAMREIEARMTELLAERGITGEKVIGSEDVKALKTQLGETKEFASEEGESMETLAADLNDEKPMRRLMRDTNNRLLGGACSGIAAYFKVDPVLVRVITIVTTFLTAGVAVPVYLLLWLVIPPARTAAERLQMAGKPVTLASIKDETEGAFDSGEPVLVAFLRYLFAGFLLLTALGTFLALAYAVYHAAPVVFAWQPQAIGYAVATGLSGVLFILFLCLIAYILLSKKFTQKIGIALLAIMLAGLLSFVVGMFGMRSPAFNRYGMQDMGGSFVTKQLDAKSLDGVKRLVVKTSDYVTINYQGQNIPVKADYVYQEHPVSKAEPKFALAREGDTATLTLVGYKDKDGQECMAYCDTHLVLDGPALDAVIVEDGTVIYSGPKEDSDALRTEAHNNGRVRIIAGVKNLSYVADGNGDIVAEDASITNASGTLKDRGSIELANIQALELTVAKACPSTPDVLPAVRYASAPKITINGEEYSGGKVIPCLKLAKTSD